MKNSGIVFGGGKPIIKIDFNEGHIVVWPEQGNPGRLDVLPYKKWTERDETAYKIGIEILDNFDK